MAVYSFIINDSDQYLTYDSSLNEWIVQNSNLTIPTPTAGEFANHGMTDLSIITEERIDDLSDEFEVMTWSDEPNDPVLVLTLEDYRPIDLLPDEFEILTATDSDVEPVIHLNVDAEHQYRYLVSKGANIYKGYDPVAEEWVKDRFMTKAEIENTPESQWGEFFQNKAYHFNQLYLRARLSSNNPNTEPTLEAITTNFSANTAPQITAELSLYESHMQATVLTATFNDAEGDNVEYRVSIRKAGKALYEKVFPGEDNAWWPANNGQEVNHTFTINNFLVGTNNIKVEVRDQIRHAVSEKILNFNFVNEDPIKASLIATDVNFTAVVEDADNDPLAYRVFINGTQKFPLSGYTTFQPQPRTIFYEWTSQDLIFNAMNEIKLEVIDQFGGKLEYSFEVLGAYKGYLFKDSNGHYFTDDLGNLLQYLEFDNLYGGQFTTPKLVYFENRTGGPVSDVTIEIMTPEPEHVFFQMSKYMPFTPTNKFVINQMLNHGDTFPFFVRMGAERYVKIPGEVDFAIKAY